MWSIFSVTTFRVTFFYYKDTTFSKQLIILEIK